MNQNPDGIRLILTTTTCVRCSATFSLTAADSPDVRLCRACTPAPTREGDDRQTHLDDFTDTVIVTTSPSVYRFRVDRLVGEERIEFFTEGGLISEFTAEFFSLLGQRSDDSHGQFQSRRHPAIRALMQRAAQQGANAVVNVRLDYEGHTGERARYVLSGTLVVLVPR